MWLNYLKSRFLVQLFFWVYPQSQNLWRTKDEANKAPSQRRQLLSEYVLCCFTAHLAAFVCQKHFHMRLCTGKAAVILLFGSLPANILTECLDCKQPISPCTVLSLQIQLTVNMWAWLQSFRDVMFANVCGDKLMLLYTVLFCSFGTTEKHKRQKCHFKKATSGQF